MKILIIIIITLVIIIIYKKNIERYKNINNKYNDLIKLLNLIKPYLEKNKIIYWAIAGTLFGIKKYNGFIPNDDDIDFAVLYDKTKIYNFYLDLDKNNIKYISNNYGFKIYYNNVSIDIFYYYTENDKLVQTKEAQLVWPNENFNYNDVFELKYKYFENILLPIPNKL
jgi:phosphorylcholine metabolism protein LicD